MSDYKPRLSPAEAGELEDWWREVSAGDLREFRPKLAEYGSHDLLVTGLGLNPTVDHTLAQVAGCAFYLLGKGARAVEAVRTGRMPSADTFHDLTVYSMMARRIQDVGSLQ